MICNVVRWSGTVALGRFRGCVTSTAAVCPQFCQCEDGGANQWSGFFRWSWNMRCLVERWFFKLVTLSFCSEQRCFTTWTDLAPGNSIALQTWHLWGGIFFFGWSKLEHIGSTWNFYLSDLSDFLILFWIFGYRGQWGGILKTLESNALPK